MFDYLTAQITFGLFSAFSFGGALYFWLYLKEVSGLTKDESALLYDKSD